MAGEIRVTLGVAAVLSIFVDEPGQSRYGYELMEETGFPSGKIYPILARLEAAAWLDRLPPVAQSGPRRAPRVPYRVNAAALPMITRELEKVANSIRAPRPAFKLRPARS